MKLIVYTPLALENTVAKLERLLRATTEKKSA